MADSPGQQEVVKLPSMTLDETEGLMRSQKICRMALNDSPQPYIIALDYVYVDGRMYFHFADYGRKMDLIARDPHVSVELDNFCGDVSGFECIALMGTLEKVTGPAEKEKAASALLDSVKARGGAKNVAARHGFASLARDALTAPGSALYRLDVHGQVALKSP